MLWMPFTIYIGIEPIEFGISEPDKSDTRINKNNNNKEARNSHESPLSPSYTHTQFNNSIGILCYFRRGSNNNNHNNISTLCKCAWPYASKVRCYNDPVLVLPHLYIGFTLCFCYVYSTNDINKIDADAVAATCFR